jgi:hypothetical protein
MALTTLDERTLLVLIDPAEQRPGHTRSPLRRPRGGGLRRLSLADTFGADGAPVVLGWVTATAGSGTVPRRPRAPCGTGSRPEGWGVAVGDLVGHHGDIVVTKRNLGAFYGTNLDVHLRRRADTQIVLAGFATSIGVESNAPATHEHGYHVTLATDAMSDRDREADRSSIERSSPPARRDRHDGGDYRAVGHDSPLARGGSPPQELSSIRS